MNSVLGVADSVGVDGEHSLALREARAVVDLADPLLAAALPKHKIITLTPND